MGRYTGPTCRKSRRYGTDLGTKSDARSIESKCRFDTPPGGRKRGRETEYGKQHRAKQVIRDTYGLREGQFRRCYKEATRRQGVTGAILLQLLESRLDNVIYRLGFAATRREARQLVSHGAILVDGKRVNIPSFAVLPEMVVSVSEKSQSQLRIKDALAQAENRPSCDWLSLSGFEGTFKRLPERAELPSEVDEQLVVELYSK